MKKVFAVYDSKSELWSDPICAPTKGAVVRSFAESVNTEGHQHNKWPDDFTLFELGEYDELMGIMRPLPAPVTVGNGLMFLVDNGVEPLKVAR